MEFALLPGSAGDVRGLDVLPWELPAGAEASADAAFTSYEREDAARELDEVDLQVCYRKGISRRQHPHLEAFKALLRRRIETTFSEVTALFGHHIQAVTFAGFQLKVCLFLLAFTINKAFI